jgi:uncharacterized membrane protein
MPASRTTARPTVALVLLGLALGGFFDGILLHQVLQWHHLLSNVGAVADVRMQLLADGLFHALMYLVAVGALLAIWRRRMGLGARGGVLAAVLAGFGLWHVLDTLLSHWLTGIHRVRVDVPDPLFWDLLWLALFGAIPLALAWWLRRRPGGGGGAATTAIALLTVAAGTWALAPRPVPATGALVLFAPGVPPARAFDALARLDARVRWVDAGGGAWAVDWAVPPSAWQLLREGAVLASGTALGLGCVASTEVAGRDSGR